MIITKSKRSALALMGLMLMLALVVAACGGDDPAPTSAPAAAAPAAAVAVPRSTPLPTPTSIPPKPTPVPKPVLIFSDLNWDSAQIQNGIARYILEEGYGYETDAVFGGTLPLMQALMDGDTNITMEIWLPNQQAAYDTAIAAGTITAIGNSLEDNWQSGFIIPQYTADANPGLLKVSDLKKPEYSSLFVTPDSKGKARNLGCIPGWECEVVNEKKILAYGLEDSVMVVNPGSGEALAAEVRAAFTKKEDILFYYWGPTTLSNDLVKDLGGYVKLEEPAYSVECWEADTGCAYPTAEVLIVVRSELVDSAPDVVAFLKNWDFNAGNQLAVEGHIADSGAEYDEAAVWFVNNTEEWKSWVAAGVADKVLAASK